MNSWTAPAKVRIAVPGLTARSVRVWGTKIVLPVQNGAIVDSFRGLRVKVYVAAPAGVSVGDCFLESLEHLSDELADDPRS